MSSKYALEVKNVSKSFRLPTEQASGIKQAVINRARGIKGYKEQHVLKDINLTINKGEKVVITKTDGTYVTIRFKGTAGERNSTILWQCRMDTLSYRRFE